MTTLLDILDHGDPCSLLLLIVILTLLGRKMVMDQPVAYLWGLRLAAGAFVAYVAYAIIRFSAWSDEDLVRVALRGLLAAGLALGATWILLPTAAFACHYTVGTFLESARRWFGAAKRQAAERKARREEEERRKQAQEEYERTAPERERARQEAEARAQAAAEAQRRREEARATLELFFALHAPELGDRFTRSMFESYVARHLGHDHPPEYVELRAQQLRDALQQLLDKLEPASRRLSLEELTQWYQSMRQKIEALPIDDRSKRTQIAQLNERYRNLVNDLMEDLQP
jgi:hypothetical protein